MYNNYFNINEEKKLLNISEKIILNLKNVKECNSLFRYSKETNIY